jgi:hypothetical protein
MPFDATPTSPPPAETLVGIDVDWMHICPQEQIVTYTLAFEYSSGRRVVQPARSVSAPDFVACIAAFMQTAPKRKFLQWLVANGYESNLTVTP